MDSIGISVWLFHFDKLICHMVHQYVRFFATYFPCFAKFQFVLLNLHCYDFHSIVIRLQKYKKIEREIRKFYFKDAPVDQHTLKQYIDLLSDINFAYGIDKSARQHAAKSPSRTFYFRYISHNFNQKFPI